MKKLKIYIEGMTCQHCVKRVSDALDSLGVDKADVEIGEATIEFDENKITIDKIGKALEGAGYRLKNWQDQ
ncbi:MAG: heavy-metal-associated domain-containing protein [Thermodesulfovibrio sp.]|nr:heavy-metal-associated domain-containing protein [Thermodesulfovibrio sp.]